MTHDSWAAGPPSSTSSASGCTATGHTDQGQHIPTFPKARHSNQGKPYLDVEVCVAVPLVGHQLAPPEKPAVHPLDALIRRLQRRKLDAHHALGVLVEHAQLERRGGGCVGLA